MTGHGLPFLYGHTIAPSAYDIASRRPLLEIYHIASLERILLEISVMKDLAYWIEQAEQPYFTGHLLHMMSLTVFIFCLYHALLMK